MGRGSGSAAGSGGLRQGLEVGPGGEQQRGEAGSMARDGAIFVTGHQGLVGGAVVDALRRGGHDPLLLRSRAELDLTDQGAVRDFFEACRPSVVIMAAARVGGIVANDRYPADFIGDNLKMQTNVIDSAYRSGVSKFVFLGTSCIYPKEPLHQPITEDLLLTGPLEPTNQWYAIAKIAGIKMCEAYRRQYGFDAISVMPANLYGPGDNFDLENAHVIPALMHRLHRARCEGAPSVTVWGSGRPRREFLYVDDMAEAIVFLMQHYSEAALINIGSGEDIAIADLARLIARVVGYEGRLEFDPARPDGVARRILDSGKLSRLGWRASVSLEEGLARTYAWFLAHEDTARLSVPVTGQG